MLKLNEIKTMPSLGQKGYRNTLEMPTLASFAYDIIAKQFDYIVCQEQGVIADQDPEFLHQMRVGFRRLQAAISLFQPAIAWPKRFKVKEFKSVLRGLGQLRDLDVQLMGIADKIEASGNPGLQQSLVRLQRDLRTHRKTAYRDVLKILQHKRAYPHFKTAMRSWLDQPHYHAVAQLPLNLCLPELLAPILSRLLLHPAWLIATEPSTPAETQALHDLRKLCKQVRYQGEFFQALYPKEFKAWVKEVKSIQTALGEMQDAVVFDEFMRHYQGDRPTPHQTTFFQTWDWASLRQKYCDPTYRRQLHALILAPTL